MKNSDFSSENVVNANYNILQIQWKKIQPTLSFFVLDDGSKFRFHELRHIVAQYLPDQCVQLEVIQTLLGHQDITTTQKRNAMHAGPGLQEKMGKIADIIPLRTISCE